ncbi:thiopurine S-methyltransferase-like [Oscarella lobularis]|uniref:thiopurine S-methyltransferase-like n=1 Tax=Oscarella lobularis TaxID=121494 RepID=UPI0033137449
MQASSLDFWAQKWANGLDTWTKPTVNTLLVGHANRLPSNEDGPKRILMPLCGRSPDIIWLLDQGYIVVGVEFVADAILQFFAETKMNYTLTDVPEIPGANLYKALEERLLIYQCNFLDLKADVIGLFDGVYDKAALVAITPSDHLKYIDVMRSVLKPTGTWLLLTVDLGVEGDQYRGPPFSVPFQAVAKLISSFFSCVEVHSCVDADEAEVLKAEKNYTFELTVRRSVIVIRPLSK